MLVAEEHPHNYCGDCDKEEGLVVTELHHIYYTMDNFFSGGALNPPGTYIHLGMQAWVGVELGGRESAQPANQPGNSS